jgi:hypothetical protein
MGISASLNAPIPAWSEGRRAAGGFGLFRM